MKIQLINKDGHKAIPRLGGTAKNPGGILLMSITTKTDPALIDQGNLLKSDWDTYSRYDSQNSLSELLQFKIRYQPTQFTVTDGCVNSIPPIQQNLT